MPLVSAFGVGEYVWRWGGAFGVGAVCLPLDGAFDVGFICAVADRLSKITKSMISGLYNKHAEPKHRKQPKRSQP